MTDNVFRTRGLKVVVDTTQTAEFDIAGFQIPPRMVSDIGRNLTEVPISPRDREVGPIRIRELFNFDVVFIITRERDEFVITVTNIRPPNPADPTEEKLKRLEIVATLRGAAGF